MLLFGLPGDCFSAALQNKWAVLLYLRKVCKGVDMVIPKYLVSIRECTITIACADMMLLK